MSVTEIVVIVLVPIGGMTLFFGLIALMVWIQEKWADPCLDYWCCSDECYE
jgi:hypothetical protein